MHGSNGEKNGVSHKRQDHRFADTIKEMGTMEEEKKYISKKLGREERQFVYVKLES